ncbi:MAG: calcium:proton antiporter [Hyphomicrobium sp.]
MDDDLVPLGWEKRIRNEAPFFLGAITLGLFLAFGDSWLADRTQLLPRAGMLVWLLAVILYCIFGVVRHADRLAEILGEPLGTLILTMSVIIIEVSLIAAVMFEGDSNPTLARDTMFAVVMIMMNGMVGLAMLAGGFRHVQQEYNLEGARAYLAVLIPLAVISLILPDWTTTTAAGTMSIAQTVFFSIATILLYGIFLGLQTMRHRGFFLEPSMVEVELEPEDPEITPPANRGRAIAGHWVMLFLTLIPIVGLAEYLAVIVEQGISDLNIPTAIGGVLIACLILAPESIASLEAALANKLQRSINLCLGSALSTLALTVPFVLIIGLVTGHTIKLGLDGDNAVLLMLTILVSMLTFGGGRTNMLQGAVHLLLFMSFVLLIFSP